MKEKIIQLREQGKTYNEIKNELGCSKGTISYHCGEGQKEKHRKTHLKKKRKNKEWLEKLKSELKCIKCNENRHWVLDFHHKNPLEKDNNVSILLISASRDRVEKEIKKCDILCANCHRDLHYKEKISTIENIV